MNGVEWRVRLILAIAGFLGLLVGIDGTLNGPWYRALGGFAWLAAFGWLAVKGPAVLVPRRVRDTLSAQMAEAMTMKKSWPLILASSLFAILCVGLAAMFLFAPWEVLLDLFSSRRSNWPGWLAELGGEWFARVAIAAVCAVAAWAAGRTALVRYHN